VRSVENERVGITGWKPSWKAVRTSYTGGVSAAVEKSPLAATLVLKGAAEGVTQLEQRITLRADSRLIELTARFLKLDVRAPESLYFAFPLNLAEGWRSHFDTAGIPVELDAEQMAGTCRDWVTVDTYASVHHGGRGVTLYCPDAPLVQVGGFQFGRNQSAIPRGRNPLLLAWPLNNYWETNFRASQPGFVEVRYAFSTHARFNAVRAAGEASQVFNPPLVHPVMRCPSPVEGRFVRVEGTGIELLHAKPAEDGQGVIVRLVNLGDAPAAAEISLPGRDVKDAWIAATQEERQERLRVVEAAVQCPLKPREVRTLRIH
jgi:hypothetical protein